MLLHEHTTKSGYTYFCRIAGDISTAVGSLPPAPYRADQTPSLIRDMIRYCHTDGVTLVCSLGSFSSADMPDESNATTRTTHNGPDSCITTHCRSRSGKIVWSRHTNTGASRHEFSNGGRGSWFVVEVIA